jgi:hypothetical protein
MTYNNFNVFGNSSTWGFRMCDSCISSRAYDSTLILRNLDYVIGCAESRVPTFVTHEQHTYRYKVAFVLAAQTSITTGEAVFFFMDEIWHFFCFCGIVLVNDFLLLVHILL